MQAVAHHGVGRRRVDGGERGQDEHVGVPEDVPEVAGPRQPARSHRQLVVASGVAPQLEEREPHGPLGVRVVGDADVDGVPALRPAPRGARPAGRRNRGRRLAQRLVRGGQRRLASRVGRERRRSAPPTARHHDPRTAAPPPRCRRPGRSPPAPTGRWRGGREPWPARSVARNVAPGTQPTRRGLGAQRHDAGPSGAAEAHRPHRRAVAVHLLAGQHPGAQVEHAHVLARWRRDLELGPRRPGKQLLVGAATVVDPRGEQQRHGRRLLRRAAHGQPGGTRGEQRLGDAVAQRVGAGLDDGPRRVGVDRPARAGGRAAQLVVEQLQEARRTPTEPPDAVRHARGLDAHRDDDGAGGLGHEHHRVAATHAAERPELVTGHQKQARADPHPPPAREQRPHRVGLVGETDLDVLGVARDPRVGQPGVLARRRVASATTSGRPSAYPASCSRRVTSATSSAMRALGGSAHAGSGSRSILRRLSRRTTTPPSAARHQLGRHLLRGGVERGVLGGGGGAARQQPGAVVAHLVQLRAAVGGEQQVARAARPRTQLAVDVLARACR